MIIDRDILKAVFWTLVIIALIAIMSDGATPL